MIGHCPTEKMLGDHFTKPLQGGLFSKFRAEIMNIPDDLEMGEMGMYGKGLKKGITCKLHNDTDPRFPQECVGSCGNTGRENGAMECPNIGLRGGTYDTVKLEKGEIAPFSLPVLPQLPTHSCGNLGSVLLCSLHVIPFFRPFLSIPIYPISRSSGMFMISALHFLNSALAVAL